MALDPILSRRLADANGPSSSLTRAPLTSRETEVVNLVAEGLTNKTVADRLGLSVRTVEGYLNHAFVKLRVESRTELVRLVLKGRPPHQLGGED